MLYCIIVMLTAAGTAYADENAPNSAKTFYFENDVFNSRDRHYTNGMKYAWMTDDPKSYYLRHAEQLWFVNALWPEYQKQVVQAVGQSIYTPMDIEKSEPIPDDRPYAGWLYYSIDLLVINKRDYNQLDITAGVIGPYSIAEQTQKFVHRSLTTSAIPRGWDNQLKTEPGLMISYDKRFRFAVLEDRWIQIDMIPHWGASLGNVMTNLRGGGTFRFGHNVPRDFGVSKMPSALMAESLKHERERRSEYGFYFFSDFEERYVYRNIFLDGNDFRSGPHVTKKSLVWDYDLGAAIVFPMVRKGVPNQIIFRSVYRTEEFKEQTGPDRYGSVMFEWWY